MAEIRVRPLRPLFHATGVYPATVAWGLNSAPRARPALSPPFREQLERYFAPDIAQLEELLGRQLWRHPA